MFFMFFVLPKKLFISISYFGGDPSKDDQDNNVDECTEGEEVAICILSFMITLFILIFISIVVSTLVLLLGFWTRQQLQSKKQKKARRTYGGYARSPKLRSLRSCSGCSPSGPLVSCSVLFMPKSPLCL